MSAVMFSVRRRDLVWSLALIVLLSAIWVARSDIADAGGAPPGGVVDFEPTPDGDGIALVYIAVGTGFADALGVGPGAGANGAPIIIVSTDPPLNAATQAELIRLDPRTLIIIGGFAAVSQAMQDAIEALLPNAAISRISGNNRYETNAALSAATFPVEGWASISAAAFTGLIPPTDGVAIGAGASNSSTGFLYGSIQLPDGAEILELKVMGGDTDGSVNLNVVLYRVSTSQETLATATLATTAGNVSFSTIDIAAGKEIVDNENFSYEIYVTGSDGNPVIRNVMVRYQLGASG